MSRPEAANLLQMLERTIRDLEDLRWEQSTPRHIVESTTANIATLEEAIKELKRLHQL